MESEPPIKKHKSDSLIDPSVTGLLRPHQVTAANFILERLLSSTDGTDDYPFPLTGAILADEMGTGKTLVGISVLWSIFKRNSCKAVVVCPPMLIGNWQNELKKWLPSTLGRSLVSVSGSNSAKTNDHIVNHFIHSHATVQPILIIGYEMFRVYAEGLNTLASLEVLICDEGHRLKNAEGTKTIQALERCCATRRLVLTGTPIQNNLEELFAVVHFVVPGYLGTLKEFKATFQDPIMRARETDSSDRCRKKGAECESKLRFLLSKILLRRTKEMVLTTLLPARYEYTLRLSLSEEQRQQYRDLAGQVLGSFCASNSSTGSGSGSGSVMTSSSLEALLSSADENQERIDSYKGILPALLNLRLICDRASEGESTIDGTENIAAAVPKQADPLGVKESVESQLKRLLESSTKLKTLDSLVSAIFDASSNSDRIVVVSNFTSVLDQAAALCRLRKWPSLKIDGGVAADRRMLMVKHFNTPSSVFRVMLLSAKAGGVGINLIGGNRLVLLEPDWNPAVDQQAMGRVWREGQTKEVFIYRLISSGTIEESILSRQMDKSGLSSVIQEGSIEGDDDDNGKVVDASVAASGDGVVSESVLDRNLTVAGLKALILPDSQSSDTSLSSDSVEDSALTRCMSASGTCIVGVSKQ